jgi:hypothetical protein
VSTFVHPTPLHLSIDALEKDLLREDGPQISTVRNYPFAILPYDPADEFTLRAAIHAVSEKLRDAGWNVASVPLHRLLLQRVRAEGEDFVGSVARREKQLEAANRGRAIQMLKDRIVPILEGPDGLARDVLAVIEKALADHPDKARRTVVFLGRAGALYPFFRTSALLKHLAARTLDVPVVLLYPGTVIGESGLSFMGALPADRDYRPRIYR